MKRLGSPRRLRVALPLLALAVLLTVPSTATASKYVWQNTIDITLKVIYPDTSITSLLPEGHPSEFWVQDLTNIKAAASADGLVLTAAEGYTLPETITVKIGQQTFPVRTDGTQNPEGITFQPETGLLSIEPSLLDENPGGVTVSAAAVEKTVATEEAPSAESTPAADTVPAEEPSVAPTAGSQDVSGPAPTADAASTPPADALPQEKTDLPESSLKEPPSEEEIVTPPQSPKVSTESDEAAEDEKTGDAEEVQPLPDTEPASGEDIQQNPTILVE